MNAINLVRLRLPFFEFSMRTEAGSRELTSYVSDVLQLSFKVTCVAFLRGKLQRHFEKCEELKKK